MKSRVNWRGFLPQCMCLRRRKATVLGDEIMHTMNKVAKVTLLFWIMKIAATTLGETGGDLLSMTLNVGYAVSSLILLGFFLVTVVVQLSVNKYHPVVYWLVIASTSTAGTTMSDYMDRSLGL